MKGLFKSDKKRKELIPDVGEPVNSNYTYKTESSSSSQSQYASNSNSYAGNPRGGPPSVTPSNAPTYRTSASSYVPPSQGGGGYGPKPPPPPSLEQAKFARPSWDQLKNRGSSSGATARAELMNGAPPPGSANDYGDSRSVRGSEQEQEVEQEQGGDEEEEEVEGIKQQIRFVKQESLASTRNAIRVGREAEETARVTLDKLGDQSDRFASTENHLDMSKALNSRAADETKELEALNRSIFRPSFTWNKQKQRDKEETRILNRHQAEKDAREDTRREQYESQHRIQGAFNGMDREAQKDMDIRSRAKARGPERQRYQFEGGESDNEVEDEIDDNLDELSGLAGRLNLLASAAGSQVDAQNTRLGVITTKVEELDRGLLRSTNRLARVK